MHPLCTPSLPMVHRLLRAHWQALRGPAACLPRLRGRLAAWLVAMRGFHSMRPFPSEKQLHSVDFHAVKLPFSSERASTTDVAPLLFAEPYSARRARCATTRSVTHGSALRGHLRKLTLEYNRSHCRPHVRRTQPPRQSISRTADIMLDTYEQILTVRNDFGEHWNISCDKVYTKPRW